MSTIDGGHYGDGVARRTKRLWTDEEKRSICLQTTASGVSVAQVALRYAVNANLIFKWRRDPRYAPDPVPAPGLPEGSRFLPVEIVAEARAPAAAPVADPANAAEESVWQVTGKALFLGSSPNFVSVLWPPPSAYPFDLRFRA